MPTTRRRRLHAVQVPLSEACRYYLRTGEYARRGQFGSWFDAFLLAGQVMRVVAERGAPPEAWLEWGEQITAEHVAQSPGSRPHGWWCFTAPGPRDCTGAEIAPPLLALWRLRRGAPYEWHEVELGTVLHLESEPHYLRRHGLLEPGERRRIALAAFEPEAITIIDDEEEEPSC